MEGFSFLFEGPEGCSCQLVARGAIYIVSYDCPTMPGFGLCRGYVQFLKSYTAEKLERKYDGISFISSENNPAVYGVLLAQFKCTIYGVPRLNLNLENIQKELKNQFDKQLEEVKEKAHKAVEKAFFRGVSAGMKKLTKNKKTL